MQPYLAPSRLAMAGSCLGIMVCPSDGEPPFPDSRFHARLCRIGDEIGLCVFVFAPEWANESGRTVTGYRHDAASGSWRMLTMPYPDLIYDRSFCGSPERTRQHHAALRAMFGDRPVPLLGRGTGSKAAVYDVLKRYSQLSAHLPETWPYTGLAQLLPKLNKWDAAVLKPEGGMHGRGVVRIAALQDGVFQLTGRTHMNRMVEQELQGDAALENALHHLTRGRRYLLQPYLPLCTSQGDAFDVRALTQKEERGQWSLTGMAVRLGPRHSLTSNLHGGGCALPLPPFLREQFGEDEARRIEDELRSLALEVPALLERHFGRLAELGLDLGVDRNGRVWIIEVNAKPGREAFAAGTAGEAAARRADACPMLYARFLLGRTPIPTHVPSTGCICRFPQADHV